MLLRSNFSPIPQYFNIYFFLKESITYSFVKFCCSIGFFLNSAHLICRSMDISKYCIGSLRLRDNERRQYFQVRCIEALSHRIDVPSNTATRLAVFAGTKKKDRKQDLIQSNRTSHSQNQERKKHTYKLINVHKRCTL